MMLKTLAVLCLVAIVSTLPVEDIKPPSKESSSHALSHGPVLVNGPSGSSLDAAPGPVLGAVPGPVFGAAPGPILGAVPGPALAPALIPHKHASKGESDLKTDATHWSYYRYNGPSFYSSHNTPYYYTYWNSYW